MPATARIAFHSPRRLRDQRLAGPAVRLSRLRRQSRDADRAWTCASTRVLPATSCFGAADVDAARLVYFGESLGSAVAAELAAEYPPAALVLRSPFTSMADVGQHHYWWLPVRWLIRDRYATIDLIGRVRSPLLIIVGERDRIVPAEFSRRLYEAATGAQGHRVHAGGRSQRLRAACRRQP